jgi:aminoglycoside 3-N-acetyltransferase
MITYHDVTSGLKQLGLDRSIPVVAHISMVRLGEVKGGADSVVGALLATVDNAIIPVFTYATMVIPENGPEDNDIVYGSGSNSNLQTSMFENSLPSDMPDSQAAEAFRAYPGSFRSRHPILSFIGLGLDAALDSQSAENPYAPIQALMDLNGWVVLIGADPSANFSLHYAEKLVGRKQFIRWALTPDGVVACPFFPGCSNGFHKVHYYLQEELKIARVDGKEWFAMPLNVLIRSARMLMQEDTLALLCNDLNCRRCNLVRKAVREQYRSR